MGIGLKPGLRGFIARLRPQPAGADAMPWPGITGVHSGASAGLLHWLAKGVLESLSAEQERWFPWCVVAFGAGIAIYFSLHSEPSVWLAAGIGIAAAIAVSRGPKAGLALRFICVLVAAGGLGFAAAKLRMVWIDSPKITRDIGPVKNTGRIERVEIRAPNRARIVLAPQSIADGKIAPPRRVRLTVAGAKAVAAAQPGAVVSVLAMLRPPPEPALPHGYDFARWAYRSRRLLFAARQFHGRTDRRLRDHAVCRVCRHSDAVRMRDEPVASDGLGRACHDGHRALGGGFARSGDSGACLACRALAAIALGGLWIALWRLKWRWLGLTPIAIALAAIAAGTPADIFIARDPQSAAVRMADGALVILGAHPDEYTAGQWLLRDGDRRELAAARGAAHCDELGCVAQTKDGRVVALSLRPGALADDWARAQIVISVVPVGTRCSGPALVLDRFDIARNGATALTLAGHTIAMETVAEDRGQRPWSLRAKN